MTTLANDTAATPTIAIDDDDAHFLECLAYTMSEAGKERLSDVLYLALRAYEDPEYPNDDTEEDIQHLENFARLLDNYAQARTAHWLETLWQWADEMVDFQDQANSTGEAVEYFQRGHVVRVLCPELCEGEMLEAV